MTNCNFYEGHANTIRFCNAFYRMGYKVLYEFENSTVSLYIHILYSYWNVLEAGRSRYTMFQFYDIKKCQYSHALLLF